MPCIEQIQVFRHDEAFRRQVKRKRHSVWRMHYFEEQKFNFSTLKKHPSGMHMQIYLYAQSKVRFRNEDKSVFMINMTMACLPMEVITMIR